MAARGPRSVPAAREGSSQGFPADRWLAHGKRRSRPFKPAGLRVPFASENMSPMNSHASTGEVGTDGVWRAGLILWAAGFCLAAGAVVFGSGSYEGLESKLSLTGAAVAVESALVATGVVAWLRGPRILGVVLVGTSLLSAVLWITEIWRHTDSETVAAEALGVSAVAAVAAVAVLLTRRDARSGPASWVTALTWLSVAVVVLLGLAALVTSGNS